MTLNPNEFDPDDWDNLSVDEIIGPPSITAVKVGDIDFPMHYEPRCYVCTSRFRLSIEYFLLRGMKPKRIMEKLAENDETHGIKILSIYRHVERGHIDGQQQLIFQKMIDKAAEQGISFQEFEETMEDEIVALELTVGKFRQALASPDYVPDIREGLAAVKMMHEIKAGAEETGVTQSDLYVMTTAFMESMQAVLNKYAPSQLPSAMEDLGTLLERNPDIAKLVAKTTVKKKVFTTDEEDDLFDTAIAAELVAAPAPPPNPINERDDEDD